MSEITLVLQSLGRGESRASEELLPLVYDELRQLAAAWNLRKWLRATALFWLQILRAWFVPLDLRFCFTHP